MSEREHSVAGHYGVGGILSAILGALEAEGKDLDALVPADLAPVDEFHIRGREATVQLAERAGLGAGQRVLDVGCGLGGSVRYLAAEHACEATGLDVTEEYVEVATVLAERVGLADRVRFQRGSGLDLPFDDGSFDVVWTEHAQMNIEDKRGFYRELQRVLTPGGRLVFHDIFQGAGGPPHYPVPWARESSISFLWPPDEVRAELEQLGFRIQNWEDVSLPSHRWFLGVLEKLQAGERPPLGLHLLMGEDSLAKLANVSRNLGEGRIAVVQAVAEKD